MSHGVDGVVDGGVDGVVDGIVHGGVDSGVDGGVGRGVNGGVGRDHHWPNYQLLPRCWGLQILHIRLNLQFLPCTW